MTDTEMSLAFIFHTASMYQVTAETNDADDGHFHSWESQENPSEHGKGWMMKLHSYLLSVSLLAFPGRGRFFSSLFSCCG